jgi:DUF1680 family protein
LDVSTTNSPYSKFRALPLHNVKITGGFWGNLQGINRRVTLLDGYKKLEQAGNFENLRHAAGLSDTPYQGPVFMDEDVYKWLEAVSHEIENSADPELVELAGRTIELLSAAQQPDGYLDSYYQVVALDKRWTDLDHGHEMYCAGHLIQAAVAHHRATGSDSLLNIARRFADHINSIFGPRRREGTCGHPEIEMALVELYRQTGAQHYLELAQCLVDRRGRNKMAGFDGYGPGYHQDRVPVREAQVVEGHAVRQLYLLAGVTDIYLETGEKALLDAALRLWDDAFTRKMYITGGFGSRYEGESFGEPYELPSDRCYCETCAAVGSAMWNWRMLLATGEARFADELERVLYNGFLSGYAHDGQHYFYVNPLESREGAERPAWHRVACCPPNIMRQVAAVGHYVATHDESGVQVHQYISSIVRTGPEGEPRTLSLETDYPWDGRVGLTIDETDSEPWQLSLRVPGWCLQPRLSVNGLDVGPVQSGSYARVKRTWAPGDVVELFLPIEPEWVRPNPRVDAVRGSVALVRGPLVYCLEEIDQERGVSLLDVWADTASELKESWEGELLGGMMVVQARGQVELSATWDGRLYETVDGDTTSNASLMLTAIPYYAWANRGKAGMRVWIPRAERERHDVDANQL